MWPVAVALCLHAFLAAICVPRILRLRPWIAAHPHSALIAWSLGFLSSCAAVATACVIGFVELFSWHHSAAPWPGYLLPAIAPWLPILVIVSSLALVSARAERLHLTASRTRRDVECLVLAPSTELMEWDGCTIAVIDVPALIAFSIGGRQPQVVVSTGLRAALDPDEFHAVVEHEIAHLRCRHHIASRLADLAVECGRWVPASHQFRANASILIELAADDRACARSGPMALTRALVKVGGGHGASQLRAGRLADAADRHASGRPLNASRSVSIRRSAPRAASSRSASRRNNSL